MTHADLGLIHWHIGHVVRRLRARAGFKQTEIATSAGVAVSVVQRLEDTGVARSAAAVAVASSVGTTLADLHFYVDQLNAAHGIENEGRKVANA